MKIKIKDLIIPCLLFIVLFISLESCASKGDKGDDPKEVSWTIVGTNLIHNDGGTITEFDLTLGVTMSVNDTILGGVILDDPLAVHPIELECFDPITYKMEVKGSDICFSDRTKAV